MEPTPPAPNSQIALQSDQTGANLAPLTKPEIFAPWHYVKEAVRIIIWNEDAVQRAKDDPAALAYGICFWVIVNTISIVMLISISSRRFVFPSPSIVVAALPLQVLIVTAVNVARLWIVHLVATQVCGGDGRFIQILRPLSLASLIQLPIAVLPLALSVLGFADAAAGALVASTILIGIANAAAGALVASTILIGIANAAVTVFVFDAVDQMPQLTAFITSVVAGLSLNFFLGYIQQSFKH